MQYHISDSNIVIENQTYTGNHYAKEEHSDGLKYGTFRSYTVLVDGDNVTFRNCVFENTSGPGKDVGQAIALYIDGNNIHLENCTLRGHQDTLFLAPLPEKEIIPGGFLGPKQFTPRHNRTVHFKDCIIEGGVDFIFGGATTYFENCEFRSVEEGYVFAPSTPSHISVGFVAKNCRFTATPKVPAASCYIARPWRNYAKVHIENCYLGEHIHPLGWDDWGKEDAHKTVEFVETGSYGPGSNLIRPDYVKVLPTQS